MRSLWLRDMNRMNLAEFLIIIEDGHTTVIGMPTMGMLFRVQNDQSWPGGLRGPTRYNVEGFLHYLASIAGVPADDDRLKEAVGGRGPEVVLSRNMKATDLAEATDFPLDEVKSVLANHLIFDPQPAES